MSSRTCKRLAVTAPLLLGLALAGCGGSGGSKPRAAATSPSSAPKATAAPSTCPLTGTAPPGGNVPQRPALAVKIGNDPSALPQSGLEATDMVVEEPIEGGITRLLAIFQCRDAAKVGPTRSARWVDTQVLARFGHPAFGYAGSINPILDLIARSNLDNLNAFAAGSPAFHRSSDRSAPENLFGSTAALWKLASTHKAPSPLFTYSTSAPTGHPSTSVKLSWTSYYSVTWTWDPTHSVWVRTEYGSAEHTASGAPVTAANLVILRMSTFPSPYVEDASGEHGVRTNTVGHGSALVMRNGQVVPGSWSSASVTSPWQLTDLAGKTIPLAPGNTWLELVPTTGSVTNR